MDLKNFKKIASDGKSTTLKHPQGHKIIIAHHALSPKMREQLKKIPNKYSYGSEGVVGSPEDERAQSARKLGISPDAIKQIDKYDVPDSQSSPPRTISSVTPEQAGYEKPWIQIAKDWHKDLTNPANPQNVAEAEWKQRDAARWAADPKNPANQAPQQSSPVGPASVSAPQESAPSPLMAAPSAPAPNAFNVGDDEYLNSYMKGIGEQKAGISQEAAAIGQQGQAENLAAQAQIDNAKLSQANYEKHYAELQAENQNVINDIKKQHINPNHYMESQSSGQKVMTAIGLILGGMGGGLLHQENPAMKFLNQQIDRDVESQKSELGKKENLLSANFKQFGNLKDATDMTRATQMNIYAAQLKQAAAKASDPQAKARALQEAGKLDTASAPILQQLAMRRSLNNSAKQDASTKIRMLVSSGIVPQGQADGMYKELGEAENMVKAKDSILGAFSQVAKLNTLGNRTMNPLQSKSQIEAIWQPVVAGLSKDTAGRFTEQDAKMLDTLKPAVSDNDRTIALKLARINALVSQKMHFPMLQAYGINPASSGRFDASGQKSIQMGEPVKR